MGGLWRFLEKYKMDKWFQKENFIMLVLAGILLVVIALPTKEEEEEKAEQMINRNDVMSEADAEDEKDEYVSYLEEKLANILSRINGAGKVYVMITLRELTEEKQSSAYNSVKTLYPRIEGVFVVAQGTGKGTVRQDITEAVQVLFGIELHKIKVAEYNVEQSHNMN